MTRSKQVLQTTITSLFAGLATSLSTGILVYFKQKAIIHHSLSLLLVLIVLFVLDQLLKNRAAIPSGIRIVALLVMILLGILLPHFLYQIRPYTFYISGMALLGVVLIAVTFRLQADHEFGSGFVFKIVFLMAYLSGTFLVPAATLQIIFVFSAIVVLFQLFENSLATKVFLIGGLSISVLVYWQLTTPIKYFEQQKSFEDKVVFAEATQFHDLVITQWQSDHWFFIDKLKNVSSIDEYLYYEPMVHSVLNMVPQTTDVLVVGGENGCLVREVLKWRQVTRIDVVSYDTIYRNIGMESTIFTKMNDNALNEHAVNIVGQNLFDFMNQCDKKYRAIFIDLPDPRDIETNQFYTVEFYNLIKKVLSDDGIMITQAGSPYFATQAFYSIGETLKETGFSALPIHNQILTLGEWGWFICSTAYSEEELKQKLHMPFVDQIATKWYNVDAASMIGSFGKTYFDTLQVGINTLDHPLVYQYYLKGNWKLN